MADNQDSAENQENATTASLRRWGRAAALVAGGLVAGGILVGTVTALAAPDDTTINDTTTAAGDDAGREGPRPEGGGHAGEEPLTGDIAAQVEAAALAEYPDATLVRLRPTPTASTRRTWRQPTERASPSRSTRASR
jgi:hypothetical protein